MSPYQALTNKVPTYTSLKAFGCLCFPLLTPYNKHKLQFKSTPCVNLGSSPQHKGYKCLNASGRVYISKDVSFHETNFPYTTLFSLSLRPLPFHLSHPQPTLKYNPQHSIPSSPLPTTPPIVTNETPPPNNIEVQPEEEPIEVSSMPSPSPLPKPIIAPPPATDTHPMTTRSCTKNLKPNSFLAHIETTSVKQSMSNPK